jgi:hypothetical protein
MTMHLATYLGMLHRGEQTLASSYRQVADGHPDEPDVVHTCALLAQECDAHVRRLEPLVRRYGEEPSGEPERLHAVGLSETRTGPLGLLRDLHDLYVLASFVDLTWILVGQAGQGARDEEIGAAVTASAGELTRHLSFLKTRTKEAAPQALLVAD